MIKILIVDDNKDNRTTVRLFLEDYENLSAFEADNAEKAIEIAKVSKPDIIFMDIMMPGMNGIDATKEIRKFDKQSMIIAMSVLSDDEHKSQMLQAGAEDYITKPINEELFVKRMDNYFKLIEYKKAKEAMEKPVNLFSDSVYSGKLGFMIDSEASLAEFWEYYLIKNHNASEALCDAVRAIYNIGLYLLPDNPSFKIVAEEDDESLFFSVVELKGFNEAKVSEILYRESSKCDIAVSEQNEISVKLPNYKVEAAPKKETMKIDGEKERILRMSHSDKIGAKSYIAELGPDIIDKLEKLEINEDKLDEAVYEYETDGNYICIARISSEFEVYASVLDTLYEFKNIAYALATLSCFMNGLMPDQIDEKKSKKLGVLLRNMVSDLMSWRKTIFVDRDTGDIHYLDSSLLSSCMQIELIFKDVEPEDDGLELF